MSVNVINSLQNYNIKDAVKPEQKKTDNEETAITEQKTNDNELNIFKPTAVLAGAALGATLFGNAPNSIANIIQDDNGDEQSWGIGGAIEAGANLAQQFIDWVGGFFKPQANDAGKEESKDKENIIDNIKK